VTQTHIAGIRGTYI